MRGIRNIHCTRYVRLRHDGNPPKNTCPMTRLYRHSHLGVHHTLSAAVSPPGAAGDNSPPGGRGGAAALLKAKLETRKGAGERKFPQTTFRRKNQYCAADTHTHIMPTHTLKRRSSARVTHTHMTHLRSHMQHKKIVI